MKKLFYILILIVPVKAGAYSLDFNYLGARQVSKDKNKVTYTKPDGTVIYTFSDREEAVLSDKTRIIRYKDGSREIFTPDGIKINIQYDGTVVYTYPNGKTKKISMEGKTPYGLEIKGERRLVNRENITVDIVYSVNKSDDLMDKNIKRFFRELVSQVQKKVAGARDPEQRAHWKLEISNCHFCRTGYCRREGKPGVTIIFFRDFKEHKRMRFHRELIIDSKKIIPVARRIAAVLAFQ